jgi:hypothetical protein
MRAHALPLLVAALVPVAVLAAWQPVALLLAAPWLVAVVWVVARSGLGVATGEAGGEFPSTAEAARRRLAAR